MRFDVCRSLLRHIFRKLFNRKLLCISFTLYCVIYLIRNFIAIIALSKSLLNIADSINPTDLIPSPSIFINEFDNENYNYYKKIKNDFNYKDRIYNSGKYFQENSRSNETINKTSYYIAEYTSGKKLKYGLNRTNLLFNRCKYKNCYFTNDIRADAVLFHDIEKDRVKEMIVKLQSKRNSEQIWVLLNDRTEEIDKSYDDGRFNWTMSFYSNSEISYCTYGCYKRLNRRLDKAKFLKRTFMQFQNRESKAVWFNNDCENKLRLEFAGELANFFPVKIYGKCKHAIERYVRRVDKKSIFAKCGKSSTCETDVLNTAKFYISFESTNCSDFITDQFWRALSSGLIPVVLQPAKQYYLHVAPYGSFIHVEDFAYDMKQLSIYLHRVANDLNLYSKYFRWKMNYKILSEKSQIEPYRLCELCARLNTDKSRSYYSSVSNWFYKKCARKSLFSKLLGFLG